MNHGNQIFSLNKVYIDSVKYFLSAVQEFEHCDSDKLLDKYDDIVGQKLMPLEIGKAAVNEQFEQMKEVLKNKIKSNIIALNHKRPAQIKKLAIREPDPIITAEDDEIVESYNDFEHQFIMGG